MLKVKPGTINIYSQAKGDVQDRIKWDMNSESRRSRRLIEGYKDTHLGESAVICCNGPSLNMVDFTLLNDVFVFGLNKINLMFSRSDFRPNSIVAINPLVISQNRDFFNETELPLFLSHKGAGDVKPRANVAFMHMVNNGSFAEDISSSVNESGTVTYAALQIAFHMGFRRVALVGADHSFTQKGNPNETVIADKADANHFDPNYFGPGVQWQLADLAQSEVGYQRAKEKYTAAGGNVINASVGGRLEIFERMTLENFLGK